MVTSLFQKVNAAARRYCMACELALGVESGFFMSMFAADPGPDLCTMKFLHYPPCPGGVAGHETDHTPAEAKRNEDASDATQALRIAEHTDWGMFTFLFLRYGAMGLQIRPVDFDEFYSFRGLSTSSDSGDSWLDCDVPSEMPPGGSALVNTGILLPLATVD
jgi:isopenicillin N synthase-like dioxygenase